MGVEFTIYKKHVRKDDLDNSINNTQIMVEHLKMELIALAAMTPDNQSDEEGWQPHEKIVNNVKTILDSLEDHIIELYQYEVIKDNEQYCPEDNSWDDE